MKVFGVGTGKSGTTTLASMFQPRYRSGHEVDAATMIPLAAEAAEARHDVDQVRAALVRRRDVHMLDVDVAGFLNPLVGELVALFPEALFILTIRGCFDWLESRIDQRALSLRRGVEGAGHLREMELRVYDEPYESDDRWLREMDMPSIGGLLHRWADANDRVLATVPPERLLVVRTEDLDTSVPEISAFIGCPADHLVPVRANARSVRSPLMDAVDRRRLVNRAEVHCADLMHQYWGPTWRDLAGT